MQQKINIEDRVMQEIAEKKVVMRPRTYFILGSFFLGMGIVGFSFLAAFFINILIFHFLENQPFNLLQLGPFGLRVFWRTFPWEALLIGIGGVLAGLFLLKQEEFSYKKGFLGLFLALFFAIMVTSVIINLAKVNEKIQGEENMRPLYSPLAYESGENWISGRITEIEEEELLLELPSGKNVDMLITEETVKPTNLELKVGEIIRAIGIWEKDVFVAKGIDSRPSNQVRKGFVRGGNQMKGYPADF